MAIIMEGSMDPRTNANAVLRFREISRPILRFRAGSEKTATGRRFRMLLRLLFANLRGFCFEFVLIDMELNICGLFEVNG